MPNQLETANESALVDPAILAFLKRMLGAQAGGQAGGALAGLSMLPIAGAIKSPELVEGGGVAGLRAAAEGAESAPKPSFRALPNVGKLSSAELAEQEANLQTVRNYLKQQGQLTSTAAYQLDKALGEVRNGRLLNSRQITQQVLKGLTAK